MMIFSLCGGKGGRGGNGVCILNNKFGARNSKVRTWEEGGSVFLRKGLITTSVPLYVCHN